MKLLRSVIRVTFLLVLILGGLIYLVMPPQPKVAVGGFGRLGGPDNGVWIALGDNYNVMVEAQRTDAARHSGAALHRLAEAGWVQFYANGTPVRVIDENLGRLAVQVTGGPDAGDWGWVQTEFVYGR